MNKSNVIWVDENDNSLGEVSREKAHAEGLLHRIAVVYLINNENQILVNERADNGLLDHSSAGHVDVGESYLEAALRELEEELGVHGVELEDLGTCRAEDVGASFRHNHIFRVFKTNALPGDIDKEEVVRVFWEDPQVILEDMRCNPTRYAEGFKSSIQFFLS